MALHLIDECVCRGYGDEDGRSCTFSDLLYVIADEPIN